MSIVPSALMSVVELGDGWSHVDKLRRSIKQQLGDN